MINKTVHNEIIETQTLGEISITKKILSKIEQRFLQQLMTKKGFKHSPHTSKSCIDKTHEICWG
jgi:hypothetical protein